MKRFIIVMLFFISSLPVLVAADLSANRAKARLGRIAGQTQPVKRDEPVTLVERLIGHAPDESSNHAQRRVGRITKQLQPVGVAATADFLEQPEYCSAIKLNWSGYLFEFGDTIIRELLENEERYKQDYFVFYHAQRSDNRLIAEFLKNIYEFTQKKPLRSDFEYLRWWRDGSGFLDVNAYLNSFSIDRISDLDKEVGMLLLAVNPVLFGNFNWGKECTFDFFLNNRSIENVIEDALNRLFTYYSFDPRYIKDLLAINDAFKTKAGDILQIFIPKGAVNSVAYLSAPGGVPLAHQIVDRDGKGLSLADYDVRRKRYIRCAGILDIIQNNVGVMEDADKIQLRLFFAKKGPLLDPDLGAKILRFTTLESGLLQRYKEQVASVSQNIFLGYKGKKYKNRKPGFHPQQNDERVSRSLTALEQERVDDAIERLSGAPTTIFEAIGYPNSVRFIKRLLAEGVDIEEKNEGGATPLIMAVRYRNLGAVRYLVEHGARLDVLDKNGETALQIAERYGFKDIVVYLKGVHQERGLPLIKSKL